MPFKSIEESDTLPCKHLFGYKEGDRHNGVACTEEDFGKHCYRCGFNPSVAHTRLAERFGDEKASECMLLSYKLAKEFWKEYRRE